MASRQSKGKNGKSERSAPIAAVQLDESKFVEFPDSPYHLYQPFLPAGDQPTAINGLVEGIHDGLSFQT